MNLYRYVGNNPINWIDPWGSKAKVITKGAYTFVKYIGDAMHGGEHIHVYARRGGELLGSITKTGKVLTGKVPKAALKIAKGAGIILTVAMIIHETAPEVAAGTLEEWADEKYKEGKVSPEDYRRISEGQMPLDEFNQLYKEVENLNSCK